MDKNRRVIIITFAIISIAATIYVVKEAILKFSSLRIDSSTGVLLEFFPVVLTILATGFLLFNFLEGKLSLSRRELSESREMQMKLVEIKKELDKAYKNVIGKGLSEDEVKTIISELVENQSQESVVKKVEEKFGKEVINKYSTLLKS